MTRKNAEYGYILVVALEDEFKKPYMLNLRQFLIQEKSKNKIIFPPNQKTFSSFH